MALAVKHLVCRLVDGFGFEACSGPGKSTSVTPDVFGVLLDFIIVDILPPVILSLFLSVIETVMLIRVRFRRIGLKAVSIISNVVLEGLEFK